MKPLLAQAAALDPKLQSIRDSFNQPNAWSEFLTLLGVVAALVGAIALGMIVRRSIRRERHRPRQLFRAITQALGIPAAECELLRRMTTDLRIEHPAVLLLSPEMLRAHHQQWIEQRGAAGPAVDEALASLMCRLQG